MDNENDILISSDSTDNTTTGYYGLGGKFGTITIDTSTLNHNTLIGTGTSGTSYSWVQPYDNGYSVTGTPGARVNINANGITMPEGSNITVGGKSLTEAIEKIEERLGILKPNPDLESRWEQLKELRKQYMELEKDLLEKEKIMKILKEK